MTGGLTLLVGLALVGWWVASVIDVVSVAAPSPGTGGDGPVVVVPAPGEATVDLEPGRYWVVATGEDIVWQSGGGPEAGLGASTITPPSVRLTGPDGTETPVAALDAPFLLDAGDEGLDAQGLGTVEVRDAGTFTLAVEAAEGPVQGAGLVADESPAGGASDTGGSAPVFAAIAGAALLVLGITQLAATAASRRSASPF